jgi:hypothetical protein
MPEDDIDIEELGVSMIVQAVTDAGTYQFPSSFRADALSFFMSGEFDNWADALQISPGTKERITALACLRNRNARQRQFG